VSASCGGSFVIGVCGGLFVIGVCVRTNALVDEVIN